MKKVLLLLAIPIFLITACTKENNLSGSLTDNILVGKWAFYNSTGINIPQDAHGNYFVDTLIYNTNSSCIFIDNKDTIGKGSFSVGYAESVNGFGTMQEYDSILLKGNFSAFIPPVYSNVLYVRQISLDTISIGS